MSFHTTIARLRVAATTRAAGDDSDHCCVRREDLRVAVHVIDRLDSDLRQANTATLSAAFTPPRSAPELQAAATRLTKLAYETRTIYGQVTCAGGKPAYPTWTDDVLAIAGLVQTRGSAPDQANSSRSTANPQ
jgi:hypothetical protein